MISLLRINECFGTNKFNNGSTKPEWIEQEEEQEEEKEQQQKQHHKRQKHENTNIKKRSPSPQNQKRVKSRKENKGNQHKQKQLQQQSQQHKKQEEQHKEQEEGKEQQQQLQVDEQQHQKQNVKNVQNNKTMIYDEIVIPIKEPHTNNLVTIKKIYYLGQFKEIIYKGINSRKNLLKYCMLQDGSVMVGDLMIYIHL